MVSLTKYNGDTSKVNFPMSKDEALRLAFGCGHIDYHAWGYHNVDLRSEFTHIDFPDVDVSQKLPWEDNTVDDILAESILEHISHGFWLGGTPYAVSHLNIVDVLKRWYKALKPGGRLIVKVPNIKGLCVQYLRGNCPPKDFWMYLYGGQEYKENTHLSGYDPEMLTNVLTLAGFVNIQIRNCHNLRENLNEDEAWEMSGIGYKPELVQ